MINKSTWHQTKNCSVGWELEAGSALPLGGDCRIWPRIVWPACNFILIVLQKWNRHFWLTGEDSRGDKTRPAVRREDKETISACLQPQTILLISPQIEWGVKAFSHTPRCWAGLFDAHVCACVSVAMLGVSSPRALPPAHSSAASSSPTPSLPTQCCSCGCCGRDCSLYVGTDEILRVSGELFRREDYESRFLACCRRVWIDMRPPHTHPHTSPQPPQPCSPVSVKPSDVSQALSWALLGRVTQWSLTFQWTHIWSLSPANLLFKVECAEFMLSRLTPSDLIFFPFTGKCCCFF